MVGAEPRGPYNRVLLSAALAGEVDDGELALDDAGWRAHAGFRLLSDCAVATLDLDQRVARLADGRLLPFDRVVLATGSTAVRLPIPGADLPGVATFRDLADLVALRKAASGRGRVAVIGGGLLGIEAAAALAKLGAAVTLVHRMDRLMERQLDCAQPPSSSARSSSAASRCGSMSKRSLSPAKRAPRDLSSPTASGSPPISSSSRSACAPTSNSRAPPDWRSVAASWSTKA